MTLDMYGFIDPVFESRPEGGVTLIVPGEGGYTGPGGTWEEGEPQRKPLQLVNIQPASLKTVETLVGQGGTVQPSDWRVVRINDGTMIYPDDTGQFAHLLEFSDGREVRQWRVRQADCRPWRNYCKVIVERYRGSN